LNTIAKLQNSFHDNTTWYGEFLFSVNVSIWATNVTAILRDVVFQQKFGHVLIYGSLGLIPFGACLTPSIKKENAILNGVPAFGHFTLTITWPDDSVVRKAFVGSHLQPLNTSLEILYWEPIDEDVVRPDLEMYNAYQVHLASTIDETSVSFLEFYVNPQLFCYNEITNSSHTVQVIETFDVLASECKIDENDRALPLPTGPLKSFQIQVVCSRAYFEIRKTVSNSELFDDIQVMYNSQQVEEVDFLVDKWKRSSTTGFELTCSFPSKTILGVSFQFTPSAFKTDSNFGIDKNLNIKGSINVYASAECQTPTFVGPQLVPPNAPFNIHFIFPKQTYTSTKEISLHLDPSAPIGGYPATLNEIAPDKNDMLQIGNSSFYNNFTISFISSNISERIGFMMLSWLIEAETCHDFVTDESKLIFAQYNITILSDGPPPDPGHHTKDGGGSHKALGAGDILAISCLGLLLLVICIFTLLYCHTLKFDDDGPFLASHYIDVEKTTVPPDYIPMHESEVNWLGSGER